MSLPKPFNLDGKVAVVTGAASGLGIMFSEAMAYAGADVVCADVNEAALSDTVKKVEGHGQKGLAVHCDVTDEGEVQAMVEKTTAEFGRLDILFNNAGIADSAPAPVHECSSEDWHNVLNVDLNGVFYCSKAALKVMVEQGSGKVVNIASIWGLAGASSVFPIPAYNAVKGAVVNLTRRDGSPVRRQGHQRQRHLPRLLLQPAGRRSVRRPRLRRGRRELHPGGEGRRPGGDEGLAIMLASEASNYMCGQMFVIDGGCLAK